MKLEPESLKISSLGPRAVGSPLQLSTAPDDGIGNYVPDAARVLYHIDFVPGQEIRADLSFEKAGPREHIFFDPVKVRAAIVTCGGLCPGLNNVIRVF